MDLKLGQTVEAKLEQGRATHRGIIRYIGEVAITGQEGDFVGLELPGPTGKNDGSVRGERFFQCAPLHGLFTRPVNISKIIAQPAPKAATRPAAPKAAAATKPAASSTRPRPSSVAISKSASQPSRLSTIGAPKSSAGQSRLSTATKATSQPPPATAQPPRFGSATSRATALSTTQSKRLSTASATQPSTTLRPTRKPSISSTASAEARLAAPSAPSATSAASTSNNRAAAERTRQIPEAEYRRLQKQQADTSALEEELQQLRTENEKVKNILTKLQAKCQQYHSDIGDARAEVKQLKAENEEQAKAIQERDSMVELATIDREMAEEQKEQLEAELENERAINEELRLELEINQEEASFITDDMPEDQKQAAMLRQAQGERDRYREGIVRLRDMTREQIKELETRVRELEAQVAHTEAVETDLAAANDKIVKYESMMTDLQEQVDASNEWEDIQEELIEQKHALEDSISRLQLERRELSTIIEVSEETINDYAEHADELQAELGTRDSQLAEVTRERDEIKEDNEELQVVLSKHREVSLELQSRLQELEAEKVMTEDEVKDVTGRFNEVMELHRRLRNASVNDTIRVIDSSLQQLTAKEAQEELDMIKLYLSESSYADFKSPSIRAYFRAKEISFKAALTSSLLRTTTIDQFGIAQGPEQVVDVLARHDVAGQLDYIHTYAEQFWTTMASCTLEEFDNAIALYDEFESVLRTVEACMSSLKKDALNLKESSDSTRGSCNVMGAIYRVHRYLFNSRPDSDIILHVAIIRTSLERIRSYFEAIKTFMNRIELPDEEGYTSIQTALDAYFEPGQTATEALGVVIRLGKILATLQNDGLYPALPDGVERLVEYRDSLDRFANRVQESAEGFIRIVMGKLAELPEQFNAEFMLTQVQFFFSEDLPAGLHECLQSVATSAVQWHEHASVLMNCAEIQAQSAPWVVKAQQIEAKKKQAVDAEKRLQVMTTELQSSLLQIREREETIDTKELEIEHLKARNQEAAVKAGTIEQLQQELNKAKAERDKYQRETEAKELEISRLSQEQKNPEFFEDPVFIPPTPQRRPERPEDTQSRTNTSGAFVTFVEALRNENHWLRQRENSDMWGHNLQAVFAKMRQDQAVHVRADSRHKQARAGDMLHMTLNPDLLGAPETPRPSVLDNSEFMSDSWTPDAKSTPVPRRRGLTRFVSGRAVSPLTLAPIQYSARRPPPFTLAPIQTATEASVAHMEDLSFVDLSPVAEEFSHEMTEALEGFSDAFA